MVPRSVENAILILQQNGEGVLTRETLVAFSYLEALKHYYPSLVTDQVRDLAECFSWVREKEPSRFIKQRRIALSHILKDLMD